MGSRVGGKRRRFRKYKVPPYLKEALAQLKPPGEMTISQWAEQNRVLERRNSDIDGPWKNWRTPYLVGIMDALSSFEIEEVVLVKPAQFGGTEAAINFLGYIVDQDPADTMVVYPSDRLAERISDSRLQPAFTSSPVLKEKFQKTASSIDELHFTGMAVYLVGANSPGNLASSPIKNLVLDEVDKFPGASKREAEPISLARERTKTFRNRKIFILSTPTTKTGHIWKEMESADEIRHYFVPCPHCGKFIELKFSQIKFPDSEEMTYSDRAEYAVYVCQECGGVITDKEKPQMLINGEWRAVETRTRFVKKVAFWSNTLYSPFTRFPDIAKKFLLSKDDPEQFQNFINSWLAEPWEDTKLRTNADLVLERQTELPAYTVPVWARFLTGGVDVQESCLYWSIRAWGEYQTSQCIAHGQAANFAEVERIMNLRFMQEETGQGYVVSLAIVDSGNDTDTVYDFCVNNSDWALPGKGASHSMETSYRLSKIEKYGPAYGAQLVLIDTAQYKRRIASRLKRDNGIGSWMVHKDTDREYAEQVTAEHEIIERSGGREVRKWVLKRSNAANHYLDTEVYNYVAADMLGVRILHLQAVEQIKPPEPAPAPAPTPEEAWISQNDGWL